MRKRNNKPKCEEPTPPTVSKTLKKGEILTDLTGKQWRLGKAVGIGGFGEIYLVSDVLGRDVRTGTPYVAKIEAHTSGSLFVEINCYLRVAKLQLLDEWKKERKISSLGMPHYVASGSYFQNDERFRFLILPRYEKDLEKILEEKRIINLKSVLTIASQIIDILDYIHSKGYTHCDIKASNILLDSQEQRKTLKRSQRNIEKRKKAPIRAKSIRDLRPRKSILYNMDNTSDDDEEELGYAKRSDQVYLLDYGLAAKFRNANGEHKPFQVDDRRAHAGTIAFCSSDAHFGVVSRRSDLESLGYNLIYWLTGSLPWSNDAESPDLVSKQKRAALENVDHFLRICFGGEYPHFLYQYFDYLQCIRFSDKPDYDFCKNLFEETLVEQGFALDNCFDFDVKQCWKPIPIKPYQKAAAKENFKIAKIFNRMSRPPLVDHQSNNIPKLRKKIKHLMKWSQILMDPETIMKNCKPKKKQEIEYPTTNIADLNLSALNPTEAMREVYNRAMERTLQPKAENGGHGEDRIEGYTPAMMHVWRRMQSRKTKETDKLITVTLKRKRRSPNRKNCEYLNKKTRKNNSNSTVMKKMWSPKMRRRSPLKRNHNSLRG